MGMMALTGLAHAQARSFSIPPQPLGQALRAFNSQSGVSLLVDMALVRSKRSPGVRGEADPETALRRLLAGTGLTYKRDGAVFVIVPLSVAVASSPSGQTAPTPRSKPEVTVVEDLVVTAQKHPEPVQKVPIAISAFSGRDLQAQKIEGGVDLFRAIPNTTFSKGNFTGYNFSIRGVGTKTTSATADPGVAVEFNQSPLIRNRLFEQEYFDIERVEVLRGPQGTLHGRNATGGVVNVVSQVADLDGSGGEIKGEIGNYDTRRLSGFVNLPLVKDRLAVRLAGAWTQRSGYDFNTTTEQSVNGRDLWSGRLSIGFAPTDRVRADFIWERFHEDDDRSRTGKQLCHRDPGPERIGDHTLGSDQLRANFSQGCKPGSLYDDGAFGTPNGLSIPFVIAGTGSVGLLTVFHQLGYSAPRRLPDGSLNPDSARVTNYILPGDPYGDLLQSRDLREIASIRNPIYRAAADVLELNISFDLTEKLKLHALTAYAEDSLYSFQDYNRFSTLPAFTDTKALFDVGLLNPTTGLYDPTPGHLASMSPGGVFCDPQIGCSKTIAGFDVSSAESVQFSQEFRLQSSFDGPVNFNLGVNYLRYSTVTEYVVMFNLLTMTALYLNDSPSVLGCRLLGEPEGPIDQPGCIYIDPNPADRINGDGHNYFRNTNPYRLSSKSVFGEIYWQASPTLKFTAGLRYTDDEKTFTPVPTQLLLSTGIYRGGDVDRGLPNDPDKVLRSGAYTGRVGADWTPDLPFTDRSMFYAFYSRGYKAGGFNPPGIGFDSTFAIRPYGPTFEPELVDAFELGAKTLLAEGAAQLNLSAYFYDYQNYQISQVQERTAINENFDAKLWGLELEGRFAVTRDLNLNIALGYGDTAIGNGEQSIDVMNRTQGDPNFVLVKPWLQLPSNCVAPLNVVEGALEASHDIALLCPGSRFSNLAEPTWPNLGEGLKADLGGNELPNAAHWTVSLGAEYGRDLFDGDWRVTLRGDAYWRSQSWARPYNLDPYDKIHGLYSVNLSLWLEAPKAALRVEVYVRNLFDSTAITDTFLNSDDSALTTNVFVLDPRVVGLSITKRF